MKSLGALTVAFVVFALPSVAALGRFQHQWSYEKLYKESDCVLIAEAFESHDAREAKDKDEAHSVPRVTTFEVKLLLKGTEDRGKITLDHFRVGRQDTSDFSYNYVVFEGNVNGGSPPRQYLMFLRKLSDGHFVPVSPQIDAALSIREIGRP